jgi:hypothetical protein
VTADTAPPCDDDGDDCHDGARGGVQACPDAVRHCRRARDDGTMPMTRAVMQRYGDRNPSTTPSLEDTDSGRSGFPGVPSFFLFFNFQISLIKGQRPSPDSNAGSEHSVEFCN